MKYLVGAIVTICILGFGLAIASYSSPLIYRDFGDRGVRPAVSKFIDPDNGVLCYVSVNGYSGGISCLKNY